jgi:hypothetical protein
MSNMAPTKKSPQPSKRPTVQDHKLAEYRRMGFTLKQAKELIATQGLFAADVRERFINKGCPPKLAFEILR